MKVIFLQYLLDSYGGIEIVNSTLSKKMHEDGHDVSLYCLWRLDGSEKINYNDEINKVVVSKKYSRPSYKIMIKNLFKLKLRDFFNDVSALTKFCMHSITDYKNMKKLIDNSTFDYIIVGNYQLLRCVPKSKLNKVLLHMHTGIDYYISNKKLLKKLLKYNNHIYKYIWLTKNAYDIAVKLGFKNSVYINNPIRFLSNKTSDLNNNKIVYIGRLSKEKRVDRLIKIFDLASRENDKITLDIYGTGYQEKDIRKLLKNLNNNRIKYCGGTNNLEDVLLNSSLLALTSLYESFSLVCIEAYECGVPVIVFDFGPNTSEVIKNDKTGFIIEKEDDVAYKRKLLEYFSRDDKKIFTKETKEFVKQFEIDNIIKEWYKILK